MGRRTASRAPPTGAGGCLPASTISTPPAQRSLTARPSRSQNGPVLSQNRRCVGGWKSAATWRPGASPCRLQLPLELPQRVGTAVAEGRGVAPRPEPGAVRHHDEHPPARAQHAGGLLEQAAGILGGLEPVHHHEPVDMPRLDGPARLLDQRRDVGQIVRPADHALRRGHQGHDPARRGEVGAQQRRGEAVARDREPARLGPDLDDPTPHRALRRAAELGPVVEAVQIGHVEMHWRRRLPALPVPPAETFPRKGVA